ARCGGWAGPCKCGSGPRCRQSGGLGVEGGHAGNLDTPLVAPDGWDWDAVLLVRYPSRQAFSAMVANPEYQKITGLRTAALDAAGLQPGNPGGLARPWPRPGRRGPI